MNQLRSNASDALPQLTLLVLRSPDSQRLANFYSQFGLAFEWHRHGSGAQHFSAQMAAGTFEIYPIDGSGKSTAGLRFGFAVRDVDGTHAALALSGGRSVSAPSTGLWGRRAIIQDPDGHKVELTQAAK